jgi:chromosome segregation ATPase
VFGVVKGEIEEMREATRKVVEQLNRRIAANSAEEELYNLQNELDYFKDQTYTLFQQNKLLREQLREVTARLTEAKADLGDCDAAMQKIQKKYLREKVRNQARQREGEGDKGEGSHGEKGEGSHGEKGEGSHGEKGSGQAGVKMIEWKKLQRESKKPSSRAVES